MRNLLVMCVFLSVFALTGCAVQLHNIKSLSKSKPFGDQGVVFGRFEAEKPGMKTAYTLLIRNVSTSQEFTYGMRSWGCPKKKECNSQMFCFFLPPGSYKISRLNIAQGAGVSSVDLDISFSVKPAATVYIGTLSIGQEITEKNYILWSRGKIGLEIRDDDHFEDHQELDETCPGVKDNEYEVAIMSRIKK